MVVDGIDVGALSEDERPCSVATVAFVFQTFGLMPVLTAAENVGVPMRLRETPEPERERRVELLLDLVGLAGHAQQRPGDCPAVSSSGWPSPARWPARRGC